MAVLTGKSIDGFEFRSVIGTGGFSTVYLARNQLGEEYAVKVLAENHAFDADIRERFISEADALRKVRSDLIIEVFDLGETDTGQPYIVMQHADRGDLVTRRRTLIDKGWKPVATDVQFLTDVIADAVEAVHVKDMIHRDVSPSNILIYSGKRNLYRAGIPFLRADESLLLADFGLVKDMSEGSGLTVGAGTPGFAAPEQRSGLSLIDHRIDIFAASAVILWFLTGATVATMPDWRKRLADDKLPHSLLEAISRGLASLAEDRHESIDEWHQDITENLLLLDDSTSGSGVSVEQNGQSNDRKKKGNSAEKAPKNPSRDASSNKPLIAGAVALTAVALTVGVGAGSLINADEDPTETVIEVSASEDSPSTTEASSLPATTSSTADSTSTSSSIDGSPDALTPAPIINESYFEFRSGQTTLTLLWPTSDPPANVVGREIDVAVNNGPFATELENPSTADQGWTFFVTGLERTPITRENTYRLRVRWMVEGGGTSEWSDVATVVADP